MDKTSAPQIKESPLFWPAFMKDNVLFILDETLIPKKIHYIPAKNVDEAIATIKDMKTRAFGQFLVVLNSFLLDLTQLKDINPQEVLKRVKIVAGQLNSSRPTFPFAEVTSQVVGWAEQAVASGENIIAVLQRNINGYLMGIRHRRLGRVQQIAQTIQDGDKVLTHCNVSGELAMAAWLCQQQKKEVQFFCTETRPYLQGAKLTAWELSEMGAKTTLIADNAVGSVMAEKLVTKVIVGSDRSCANGDFANKIGTYQIAVLAKEFNIPFYVLLQPSNKIPSGDQIPIEFRSPEELLSFEGQRFIEGNVDGFYPGFDVVPHELVTGSINIEAGAGR